jgi:hypothetical protein
MSRASPGEPRPSPTPSIGAVRGMEGEMQGDDAPALDMDELE